jgi:hypothetical protein
MCSKLTSTSTFSGIKLINDMCIYAGFLALIKARGAARPESSWPWEPNLVEIDWFYITITLKNGAVVTGVPVSASKPIQRQSQVLSWSLSSGTNALPTVFELWLS